MGVQNLPNRVGPKITSTTRNDVDPPHDIAKQLETAWRHVSRGALEAVALEGYRDAARSRVSRSGVFSGLSFWDTEAFLKERQAYLEYDDEDFERDSRNLDGVPPR